MGMAATLVMWPDPVNKLSFPHPTEAPYEIWLWLAQPFWRRSLKSVDMDDGRTDDRPRLYYKLTNEPKGSGELMILWFIVKYESLFYYHFKITVTTIVKTLGDSFN